MQLLEGSHSNLYFLVSWGPLCYLMNFLWREGRGSSTLECKPQYDQPNTPKEAEPCCRHADKCLQRMVTRGEKAWQGSVTQGTKKPGLREMAAVCLMLGNTKSTEAGRTFLGWDQNESPLYSTGHLPKQKPRDKSTQRIPGPLGFLESST